ncbi:uncharacterized protein LOC123554765 isoform X2 [Mercenaria mercenaria]|uniref:uncharacterized protein LOC123554765 isoform X2 n=1 Tax=Mercenaria mercenaria TaxID=6596 RepID=UPI00234E7178|nr:uncharacterized protein LOC123554765 isoform X2 [Mercenaria mercenaria]
MDVKSGCVNCNKEFEVTGKGYKRTFLVSDKRSEIDIKGVLEIDIPPKFPKRESRFVCTECDKLLKSAIEGHRAKEELMKRTDESSYISRKRKLELSPHCSSKIPRKSQTATTSRKKSNGAKYFASYRYKQGFKFYMKSKAAVQAMRSILRKETRKGMKKLVKNGQLPNAGSLSVESFSKMSFSKLLEEVKTSAPFLYDTVLASLTESSTGENLRVNSELVPIIGSIISIIIGTVSPRKASLFQKMNAVQMWRAGSKSSLFQNFKRLGFSVSEKTLLSSLDVLRRSFDTKLLIWKAELQDYISPPGVQAASSVQELHTVHSSTEILESETRNASSTSDAESDKEQEDVREEDEERDKADKTIQYSATIVPRGYTICLDNVGEQVTARHHTRNQGNKDKSRALAYVAKNRIQTTHFDDEESVAASEIPTESFFVTNAEAGLVREEMVLMVQRIITEYLSLFQPLKDSVLESRHMYETESAGKSELFNIGVINENPSTCDGVINIMEQLHKYVPVKADGSPFRILTWGDGLSCERHVDAQNARANGADLFAKLQGLEPAAQEFHKRMILMQDTMDKLYSGKSASEKGTLSQLKNLFNQRSVKRNVSESFDNVSDFLKFVTEGYVVLFALDMMDLDGISHVPADLDYNTLENELQRITQVIVNTVWNNISKVPVEETDADDCEYCICKEEIDDCTLIECENESCEFGQWFHLDCKGLDEDDLPETWYCCHECELCADKAAEDIDGKFEYVKTVIWRGLSDMIRRDAVRKNNGPMMALYWKVDMLEFARYNHTQDLILAHRLIASLSGFLPERLRQDLLWNRTVNLHGGRGNNEEADLVNEFLNIEKG